MSGHKLRNNIPWCNLLKMKLYIHFKFTALAGTMYIIQKTIIVRVVEIDGR